MGLIRELDRLPPPVFLFSGVSWVLAVWVTVDVEALLVVAVRPGDDVGSAQQRRVGDTRNGHRPFQ